MADKLTKGAELNVSADDIAVILTSHFCGYGPLDGLEIVNVNQDGASGNFHLEFAPKLPSAPKQENK